MRLSSQRSSSTTSTGTLVAARDRPVFRRRIASSRPRLCGIETTSGADIVADPPLTTPDVIPRLSKGRGARNIVAQKTELSRFPLVLSAEGSDAPPCRAEEKFNVTRNNHSHYSHHRAARRFQRRRRRTVLRHRLLRRRRPRPCGRDFAYPVAAREAVSEAS